MHRQRCGARMGRGGGLPGRGATSRTLKRRHDAPRSSTPSYTSTISPTSEKRAAYPFSAQSKSGMNAAGRLASVRWRCRAAAREWAPYPSPVARRGLPQRADEQRAGGRTPHHTTVARGGRCTPAWMVEGVRTLLRPFGDHFAPLPRRLLLDRRLEPAACPGRGSRHLSPRIAHGARSAGAAPTGAAGRRF